MALLDLTVITSAAFECFLLWQKGGLGDMAGDFEMSRIFCMTQEGPKYMFVYMVDYIDGFLYVELSLHSWDKANLIMVDDFFDVFLDSICQYFVEYFCIDVHEGYWSV
ncbi:putative disks large-like protein [Cricetulus griseus]|uniref:Putative disks large-like protein n=1 Tax=Cricetulus griseus TaxID=10029 RepID=A0A061IGI6_CRIGR|nr:putative disks large-like protein [Cricetulus griseus]